MIFYFITNNMLSDKTKSFLSEYLKMLHQQGESASYKCHACCGWEDWQKTDRLMHGEEGMPISRLIIL